MVQQRVLRIDYQSFSARLPQTFTFHVWWLKEFKNRWFAVGVCNGKRYIMNLALDRMQCVAAAPDVDYIANQHLNPDVYYRDVIGVSVNEGMRPIKVSLFVCQLHAPYVETKPLHQSQQVVERRPDGIVIQLTVQHNFELEKEILGFGEGMQVLEPERLRRVIIRRLKAGTDAYLAAESAPSVSE